MKYKIKELCKEKNILIKDLAKKIGITDIGLRQALKGNPTIGTLEKIAEQLEVNVSDLLDEPCATTATKSGITIRCPHCTKAFSIDANVTINVQNDEQ